jgi:sugar lactone lactonase YvrE
VVLQETIGSNGVASLPDGGMVVTNWLTRGDVNIFAKLAAGQNTGEVWEWHATGGWKVVPETEMPGPNGILASPDGKWLYIAGWGNKTLVRLSRGQTPPKRDVISTEFHIDNLGWQTDGSIFATGQYGTAEAILKTARDGWQIDVSTAVARIDPKTLSVSRPLVRYPSNSVFRFGTAAVQVGHELWVGDATGDRIARFPAP